MRAYLNNFLFCSFIIVGINANSQQHINLSNKLISKELTAVNRLISSYDDKTKAVEMNAQNSDGLGILEGIEFDSGIIEIELLGENKPGKSFVGIAFNIQDDSTYEVIYFRPFNFVANEQIRKEHMVQYIFHPEFTWRKLRSERTGEFENEIKNPPNPDDWFKVKIEINHKKVTVFVNELRTPVLIVDRLTSSKSKKIGLWTGYGSSGRFRNLILR
jgi:hypothetical protein